MRVRADTSPYSQSVRTIVLRFLGEGIAEESGAATRSLLRDN